MTISVAARKAKGRELQKWVCQKISEIIHLPWGPDEPISSRGMGQSGTDVRLDKKALKLFKFSVECKRQEKWNIPQWIEQAKQNRIQDTDWLLVVRSSHQVPIVIMDANAFFEMLGKYANTQDSKNNGNGEKSKKVFRRKSQNG